MEIMNKDTNMFIRKLYSTMATGMADDDTLDPTGNY